MRGQHPMLLSHDAGRVMEWARELDTVRDSFSREARPEQIERITIRPGRLRQGWHGPRQFCRRQVMENLHMSGDRADRAVRELRRGGLVRDRGFGQELTDAVDAIYGERTITRDGVFVA